MRIKNHDFRIFDGRQGEERAWDMPLSAPAHHWAVPLALIDGQGVRRVGTAFHFSHLGHLFSARHCTDEAIDPTQRATNLAGREEKIRLTGQLIVVRANEDDRDQVTALPVQTVTSPEPTDLVCISTVTQEHTPQLTLPLSFALPPAGSVVRCFGFPKGADARLFPESLHVVEGTVKAYFPPGFSRGFMRGPCFLVDASVPHGMSGGPVVNEEGAVCGVISAGAELFFTEPRCLISPLYPALLTEVALHAQPAPNVRINGSRLLIDLCAQGHVRTDGTEGQVHFANVDGGIEIGPVMQRPNGAFVYNSFDDYLEGRPSTPLVEPRMRFVKHEDIDATGDRAVDD